MLINSVDTWAYIPLGTSKARWGYTSELFSSCLHWSRVVPAGVNSLAVAGLGIRQDD